MAQPDNHSTLIDALGGPPAVASFLSIQQVNVRQWRARNRIPPEHWSELIKRGEAMGVPVDADWFLRTMPPRAALSSEREAAQ